MTFHEWLRARDIDPDTLPAARRRDLLAEYGAAARAFRLDTGFQTREAPITPTSLDRDARSVEALLSTELPVRVFSYESWDLMDEVLRLDGMTPPAQVPLLDAHSHVSQEKVLGSVRDIRAAGDELLGRLYFSTVDNADDAFTKAAEGHLTDVSIGYWPDAWTDIAPGKKATVASKDYEAGLLRLRIVTAWRLSETSVCPIGADQTAKLRQAAGEGPPMRRRERTMDEFKQWLKARGLDPDALSDVERTRLQAEFDVERSATPPADAPAPPAGRADVPAPAAPPAPPAPAAPPEPARTTEEVAAAAVRAERERTATIRTEAAGLDVDPDLVERQVTEGRTVEQARAAFLEAVRTRTQPLGAPSLNVGAASGLTPARAFEAAMLIREGFTFEELERAHIGVVNVDVPPTREELTRFYEAGHGFRQMSIIDFCRESLRAEGIRIPASREEMIRAAFSTVVLTTALSNVANKAVMTGFRLAQQTAMRWCRKKTVRDFKLQTRVRGSDGEDWEVVAPGGEITHANISELAETYRIDTYAKQLRLTRQDIINDDLGVLADRGRRLGVAGMRTVDNIVYTHLMANGNLSDGVALFHATHANYDAANALADATLASAKARMRKQVGLDSEALGIEPRFLIVVPELEHTALRLVRSQEVRYQADDETYGGTYNVHRGQFEVVVESRLSNSGYTGYKVDQWYLAASPDQADTIEIGFLNGVQRPTVERITLPGDVLGIGFRGYIDVGVKALDHRGMYLSKGS